MRLRETAFTVACCCFLSACSGASPGDEAGGTTAIAQDWVTWKAKGHRLFAHHPHFPRHREGHHAHRHGASCGVRELVAGGEQTCVLTHDDRVRCWGWNEAGDLG